jgi:hypothetical protein
MLLSAPSKKVSGVRCCRGNQWIMTLEEEDLDGGYVPEESRQNERSGMA